ncbi:MAG: nucleoside triphosphate pyrophosphohydrolase [Bacteroidales bacterium]|nr:nucleoside triphosphate pyrophosphohydrolase [Bacteroidales bacterium]
MDTRLEAFKRLLDIMDELRAKCPWDKEQTFESIRHLTIEETYELSEAILEKSGNDIKKELGDLLLHIVFYAKIGSEQKLFDIEDVINSINEKLVNRHPHIFANVVAEDANKVKENWENIKMKEGNRSVLSGVPLSLPALVKAYRIQDKARGIGFDWEKPNQVWEKVEEEIGELKTELDLNTSPEKIESEFGDLMFALINYARFIGVNPENALERTNKKFIKRFMYLEKKALEMGRTLKSMSLEEMDVFWNEAKAFE